MLYYVLLVMGVKCQILLVQKFVPQNTFGSLRLSLLSHFSSESK